MVPTPIEALRKQVEGMVRMCVTVGSDGKVVSARAISGPPELIPAALESVKQWTFEPPFQPPAVVEANIGYGYPKECSGSVSDSGRVMASGRLKNATGNYAYANESYTLPPYPEEERKAGVAGKLILALTIDSQGAVTKIRVVHSLSPRLDAIAIETVRTWRFNAAASKPGTLPGEFPISILYTPDCYPTL